MMPPDEREVERSAIRARYARRHVDADTYSALRPWVYMRVQERQRALIRRLCRFANSIDRLTVLEIGCGTGGNLLELLALGFAAENLAGIDLLDSRIQEARRRLPSAVQLLCGDALTTDVGGRQFDIVYASTVFSSILDDAYQQELAWRIWSLTREGGEVLWYDFTFNNPNNPDVRGVPLSRVRTLFPGGAVDHERVTLAPPLSRIVCRIHASLYHVFNVIPALRTHLLCEIRKPAGSR